LQVVEYRGNRAGGIGPVTDKEKPAGVHLPISNPQVTPQLLARAAAR
jgi:hypothetical protein